MSGAASRPHPGGVRVLDRLRDEGRISAAQYESLYHQAKRSGERVEESILEAGAMGEADLMKFVAALYQTRFVSTERLSKADIDRGTLELVPRRVAERLQCVPILHDRRTQTLSVVALDLEEDVAKQLQVLTGLREVRVFVARPAAVRAAIRRFYGGDPHAFASIGGSAPALGLDAFERGGTAEIARPAGVELDLGGFGAWDDRTPAPVPLPVAPVAPRAPSPVRDAPIDLTPIRMDVTEAPRGVEWESYLETLNVLVALLDGGRAELRGHSSLVARIAKQITERLGLPEDDRHAIAIAAYLHDVGKASAYHLTLLNVSRFDGHRLQAQRSAGAPARMLESARLPERAIDVLGHLYERFDGQGFPDRQAGKDIPLGARIVALVETYADLTANPKNPYRRTLAPGEAIDVVRQLAGSLFDPMLVDVLRGIVLGAGDPAAAKGAVRNRVLVVDPDREETTLLELRLAEAGHDVVVARDRAEVERTLADARTGERRFDLVLSELELGAEDGFALLAALRADARTEDVPLVFITRKADGESVARGFELGAADFLVKPVSAELVVAKTAQLIEAGWRKRSGGLAGSLRDMGLPDVLQALANGRKTGLLRIRSGTQSGEIQFLEGAIANATFGRRTKQDAVYAMLALSDGDFALDPAFRPAERAMHDSCEALLLEGMRRIDEGQV